MDCSLCLRDREFLEFHHLIPRANHTNKWFRKNYSNYDMTHRGINICTECHVALHRFYPAKQLGKEFNTRDQILSDEKMVNAIRFIRKQK